VAALALASARELPYRKDLVAFLSAEANAGRSLILATAADERVALEIARHLGIFERVIASDGVINRKGSHKLEAVKKVSGTFLYAGDSMADLPLWKESIGAIVAGDNRQVLNCLRQSGVTVYRHFPSRKPLLRSLAKAVRVHQWPKNLLVLLPIFLGHRTADVGVWKSAMLATIVFCLVASVAYVGNDLMDLEADRQHSKKCARPFASGDLSIPTALLLLMGLAAVAVGLCLLLPAAAQLWIAGYFAATLFYSIYLKTKLLADVVGLALLYAMRVVTGGAASGIVISPWTVAFCLFFFFSIALAKRFGELRALPDSREAPARRGYQKADLSIVGALGVSAGVLSVLVFSLYISSPEVRLHYPSPSFLWLACPVILYWFGRLWILANRGVITDDPLLFCFKDRLSYLSAGFVAMAWAAASRAW
jgi:4-hydroxybenzoate polyprenyltransferase